MNIKARFRNTSFLNVSQRCISARLFWHKSRVALSQSYAQIQPEKRRKSDIRTRTILIRYEKEVARKSIFFVVKSLFANVYCFVQKRCDSRPLEPRVFEISCAEHRNSRHSSLLATFKLRSLSHYRLSLRTVSPHRGCPHLFP